MARTIAAKPLFELTPSKAAKNQTRDAQVQWTAMPATFLMHTLAHTRRREPTAALCTAAGASIVRGRSGEHALCRRRDPMAAPSRRVFREPTPNCAARRPPEPARDGGHAL